VLRAGEVFEHPRTGSRLEVVSTAREGGQVLTVDRLLKPHTGKAGAHRHLDFQHRFEVLQGRMEIAVDGEERSHGAGESVAVPVGTPHVDPWNASDEDVLFRTQFEPVPDFVEAFTEVFGHLLGEGRTDDQDFVPNPELFVVLHATRGQSYAVGSPIWLQRAILPALAWLGRRRGYEASYS
jgi:mannose-6-phosphate isomerase-like protein (cupin superfamily)